jgi:hypothetical protein
MGRLSMIGLEILRGLHDSSTNCYPRACIVHFPGEILLKEENFFVVTTSVSRTQLPCDIVCYVVYERVSELLGDLVTLCII